jgi:type VI secretion system protein ImpF
MAANNEYLQSSIIDRLIDYEPRVKQETSVSRRFGKADIRDAVVRDLENLFNTRQYIQMPDEEYPQVLNSVFGYGLRDFSSENPKSPFVRRRLRQEIEETIAHYEPRLKNVAVRLDTPDEAFRTFSFRITGVLEVEPISEPVVFDTYFDVNRGEYVIEK